MDRRRQVRLLDESDTAPAAPPCVLLEADFPFLARRVALRVEAPDRRLTLADVVPLARAVCDRLTEIVLRRVRDDGRAVTCAKGCGVCCTNYLVPATVPEAFRIRQEVGAQGGAERRRVEAAFAAAAGKVADSGLAEAMGRLDRDRADAVAAQREAAGKWWAEHRFPCPLLLDGACSHYDSRPIPCREFLVVSPPPRCAANSEIRVRRPFSLHTVLSNWAAELEGGDPALILLPQVLAWCEGKTARSQRTWRGPEMVGRFLNRLAEAAVAADARGGPLYKASAEPSSAEP